MIYVWSNATSNSVRNMFNGSAASIARIENLIKDGHFMEQDSSLQSDPQVNVEAAAYGLLIPVAWNMSNAGLSPFILQGGNNCSSHSSQWVPDDVASVSWTCYNSTVYYLVTPSGFFGGECVRGRPSQCYVNQFSAVPGVSELNSSSYGGITPRQFIIGQVFFSLLYNYFLAGQACDGANILFIRSVNGYQANNNQNGWPALVASDLEQYYENFTNTNDYLETPGLMQLPVCDAQIAYNNWANQDPLISHYPCNRDVSQRCNLTEGLCSL